MNDSVLLQCNNSTYPSWCEEMPVSVRCIAIGCKCFLSFCKQVISTSGTKHFIGKAETSLNWANFGTSHRMLLTGHFQRTDGVEKETSAEETNTEAERRGTPTRGIQMWSEGPLHYVLSSDGEVCIWDLSNTLKLWSFTIDKWKNKMATSLRQLEKKKKIIIIKKKPTNIHNNQAMLLHKTKAPLSQICLNFWQQRKLNNMAFFFFLN